MVQNERAAVLIPVQEKADLGMTALDDFTPLVRSHQQRIYRVLLGMLRDPDAAETLTQECFLKAYQGVLPSGVRRVWAFGCSKSP